MKHQFGKFIKATAGYEINTLKLPTSWEYIYENRDILLKVDQYGPVYAQANPPGDVMLFKRETHEKFSPWLYRIAVDGVEGEFSNFFKPNTYLPDAEPENISIRFLPECAVYSFEYAGLKMETELFIPNHGIEIVYKLKLTNVSNEQKGITLSSQFIPYFNDAQMAPWDKFEWYLDSAYANGIFQSKLLNANAASKEKRYLFLDTGKDMPSEHELSLEKYIGFGDALRPEKNYTGSVRIYGYPPVYAGKYGLTLGCGESKEFTQILSVGTEMTHRDYADDEIYAGEMQARKAYFHRLFANNRIKTGDEQFDYYANYWVPMQMHWVASLDRGWPTGMRGSRDSAQDYTGLLYVSPKECKPILMTMLECQRTDGWFPRQYSAIGKHGKHDLRGHVDGGAFTVEFIWKYLAHTKDFGILREKVQWLDTDEENTVLEHLIRAVEYYICDENLGEHGLCKIREGDWLDAVNCAGLEGRGESVTVSAQTVMSLEYLADILTYLDPSADVSQYLSFAEKLKENINRFAYNASGFYNGVFNDNGHWIFSDKDPDGKKRMYGVSNYYAIIAKVANKEQTEAIFANLDYLKCEMGYRLFYPYLGETPMDKVGRIASGDMPPHLIENGNVYNHGSNGFLARAFACAGKGNELYETLKYLMPYDTRLHPTEQTFTPPYAIVNCYQELPAFLHRGLMYFLTGSVAMAMRGVFEWMLGVKPTLRGIEISPCLPDFMTDVEYDFHYLGEMVHLEIKNRNEVYINGKKYEGGKKK